MTSSANALIDRWFPVAAVDEACGTPAGSGRNEKAIFTWFASRPIAQARAAVLCSLLPDPGDDDVELQEMVGAAVLTGDDKILAKLSDRIPLVAGKPAVVLDCFSGRGIIPLEAARLGLRAVGTDLSPVAVLASRLLADYALRDWGTEPPLPFASDDSSSDTLMGDDEPRLTADLAGFLIEVSRRVRAALNGFYVANRDSSFPWGYLWATTIPCDSCKARFPMVGSLVLRYPNERQRDQGQSVEIVANRQSCTWRIEIHEGAPKGQPTYRAASGRRGKSANCPFCGHVHPLDTVKAKGFAGQYEDAVLLAADLVVASVPSGRAGTRTIEQKVFRSLSDEERRAAYSIDIEAQPGFGDMPAAPAEEVAPGNASTVDATGYGYRTFADLMNERQVLHFVEIARAIRSCHADVISAGTSKEYAQALASYAAAVLVRKMRSSTRGARLRPFGGNASRAQTWVQVHDVFANESGVNFNFDFFETGPGGGPGTWDSVSRTGLTVLRKHIQGMQATARAVKCRRASATALPYRDGTVDAVVCDPPYYDMINYADVSDLFYVWLRRCLFDIVPDLFGQPGDAFGLQDKSDEIVVKQGRAPNDHRTPQWYEARLGVAFTEMRRVLRPGGVLAVVFGHSDPEAWRRVLRALREAGFIVTSAWPARTESANTGVASIKVTVTIGCRVAPDGRTSATAARVEREINQLVRKRVRKWDSWGLALSDQLMASYGPAMQVVGRYRTIQLPDGTEPDLDHFLAVGRRAVADAHAFKVDELPLDTFDPHTRFSIFWMRAFKRTTLNKGEAVFHAQSSQMRIDELRPHILDEAKGGYRLTLGVPPTITERSPAIHVARALAAAWPAGGTEAAAQVLADSRRSVDDPHVWATIGELVRQLPGSDKVAMALTACQRNRRAIESSARHAAATASTKGQQDSLFDLPGTSR